MVSVVIVNYNTGKFIFECIASIKKYAPDDTEIIVVDNNSSDGSREKLEVRKEIHLIENKENLGYSKAVNQGIRKSKGDYLFILNPDTELTEDALDALVGFTLLHKGVIVGPRLLNPDGSVQASCYHEPTIWAAIKQYFINIKGAFDKYAPAGDELVIVDAVVGAAMFIPRKVINNVGLFDESYFMYFEDLDYCRRVRRAGLSVYYLPSAVVYHEHGGVTRTVGEKAKIWLIESSKVYHGEVEYYLLTLILWLGQKWRKLNEKS